MIRSSLAVLCLLLAFAAEGSSVHLQCWYSGSNKNWQNTVMYIGRGDNWGLEKLVVEGNDVTSGVFFGDYRLRTQCFNFVPECSGRLSIEAKNIEVEFNLSLIEELPDADVLEGEIVVANGKTVNVACHRGVMTTRQ